MEPKKYDAALNNSASYKLWWSILYYGQPLLLECRHERKSKCKVLIFILLRLPICFFNVLCHKHPSIYEPLYIRDIVILSNVYATTGSQQESEAAPDYPHWQLLYKEICKKKNISLSHFLRGGISNRAKAAHVCQISINR